MAEFDNEVEFMRAVQKDQMRDDVQEFMQVYNLATDGDVILLASVSVAWRGWFAAGESFMAKCQLKRKEQKRYRTIEAFADSRIGALEALASEVASILNPVPSLNGG